MLPLLLPLAGLLAPFQASKGNVAQNIEPADLVLVGKVFTADPIQPWADAIAIRGDAVVAIGTTADLKPYVGPLTRVLQEPSGTIAPGFNDAHTHLLVAAALEKDLDLAKESEAKGVMDRIREWLGAHPADEVFQGVGLSAEMAASDPNFLWRFEQATYGRSALLWGAGTTWVLANEAARARLGLAPGVKLPRGVFWFPERPNLPVELFAGPLLLETFGSLALPGPEELEKRLVLACAGANRLGITSIQEALPIALIRALRSMHDRGELTLRVHALTAAEGDPDPVPVVPVDPDDIDPEEHVPPPPSAPWITFGTLELDRQEKLFATGSLSPSTLIRAGDVRSRRVAPTSADSEPLRTVESTLQIPESALGAYVGRNLVVTVVPGALLAVAESISGKEALPCPEAEILPLRSLSDRGATIAFGSDYDRLSQDPLRSLYAAVSRTSSIDTTVLARRPPDATGRKRSKRPNREPNREEPKQRVFAEQERISIVEALRACTVNPARAEGTASMKGTLGPGKVADLVLFETNLVDTEPRQLLQAQLRATIVGGKIVYGH